MSVNIMKIILLRLSCDKHVNYANDSFCSTKM